MPPTDDEINAVEIDLALWKLAKAITELYATESVAARFVCVAAQMCARLGIPPAIAATAFRSNYDVECERMTQERMKEAN